MFVVYINHGASSSSADETDADSENEGLIKERSSRRSKSLSQSSHADPEQDGGHKDLEIGRRAKRARKEARLIEMAKARRSDHAAQVVSPLRFARQMWTMLR